MKLQKLQLKNIGPFLDDEIDFATFENSESQAIILRSIEPYFAYLI